MLSVHPSVTVPRLTNTSSSRNVPSAAGPNGTTPTTTIASSMFRTCSPQVSKRPQGLEQFREPVQVQENHRRQQHDVRGCQSDRQPRPPAPLFEPGARAGPERSGREDDGQDG